jgi:hypothetical protein
VQVGARKVMTQAEVTQSNPADVRVRRSTLTREQPERDVATRVRARSLPRAPEVEQRP